MRVTILCPDLSENGAGRGYMIGEVLSLDHEVEIVGTTFGEGIWPPIDTGRFDYGWVRGSRWPRYYRAAADLLGRIRGDVVYAIKPLPTSYGIALLHRARTGRPVILDIDDDELAFQPARSLVNPLRMANSVMHPNGRFWTRAVVGRSRTADAVTVASKGLQARFGGTLLPHARDTDRLQPRPEWSARAKEAIGAAGRRVVMFMGTPRPHKGVDDAAAAVALMRNEATLVIVGANPRDPYIASIISRYPEVVTYPPYSVEEVPFLLEAADAVIVPQRRTPQAAAQLPAKMLDAMALAKPVVATAVADIPEILAEGRGQIAPPGDVPAMASALDAIFDLPDGGAAMGARAREWIERYASYHSARRTLADVLGSITSRVPGASVPGAAP